QLHSLERQAKKAQQYKTLQAEKRDLGLALVAADYAGLRSEGERMAGELVRLRDTEEGLRTRITSLAAREAQARETMQASEHRLSDLRQAVSKVQGELERLLERREQMGVQIQELGEEGVRLAEEVRASTERLASIVKEREDVRLALRDVEQLATDRARAAAEFESRDDERRRLDAQEADEARRLTEAESRLADARVELAARRSSFEALSELERAREGYGAGVRAVFADDRIAALAGVVGTVA